MKINELLPEYRKQATDMLRDCCKQNRLFKISEVYRSEDDHILKYLSGRSELPDVDEATKVKMEKCMQKKPSLRYGDILTNTAVSTHPLRKALDIKPINCSFADIHVIAVQYGIDWTIPDERWHFEIVAPYKREVIKQKSRNFFHRFFK